MRKIGSGGSTALLYVRLTFSWLQQLGPEHVLVQSSKGHNAAAQPDMSKAAFLPIHEQC